MTSKPKQLILTSKSSYQPFYLSGEIIDRLWYLRGKAIVDVLDAATHRIITKGHSSPIAHGSTVGPFKTIFKIFWKTKH
jgi:hypothetical protein